MLVNAVKVNTEYVYTSEDYETEIELSEYSKRVTARNKAREEKPE